jgi:hypothetical protein
VATTSRTLAKPEALGRGLRQAQPARD